jgi:hypothetical protein
MASMGKWLVGCSVVFLIVLVILLLIGFLLFREMKEIGDTVAEASTRLQQLEEQYPFERPDGGLIDENRFTRFLEARRLVAGEAKGFIEEMQQGSVLRQISTGLRGFQQMLPAFGEALDTARMSAPEYRFYGFEMMYALRYSEQPEVAEKYPELRTLSDEHEDLLRKLEDFDFEGAWNLVFRIDPYRLVVPEENLEVMVRHAGEIGETVDAVLVEQFFLEKVFESTPAVEEGAVDGAASESGTEPDDASGEGE